MDRFAFLSASWRICVKKFITQTHLAKLSLPELSFGVRLTAIRSLAI
ncbi:hypothetical protein OAF24_01610 [bacterium]|nr:hypothetical protein [bacterium]